MEYEYHHQQQRHRSESFHDKDIPHRKRRDLCSNSSSPDRKSRKSKAAIPSYSREKPRLPIEEYRQELMEAIQDHDVLIIMGETGSGKTTKIPQYLMDYDKDARIVVTQPRRVAAIAAASWVAEERDVELGTEVGYTIRFDDCTSAEHTRLRYVTDGVLLRECLDDPFLSRYDIVVLDEAHERSLGTDVLFGLMKRLRKRRRRPLSSSSESLMATAMATTDSQFRLLIMSATLNSEKFSEFFEDAPLFHIPGRSFDVEIFYMEDRTDDDSITTIISEVPDIPQLPPKGMEDEEDEKVVAEQGGRGEKTNNRNRNKEEDSTRPSLAYYIRHALEKVIEIHRNEEVGDVLVFLTGQKEIEEGCRTLERMVIEMDYHHLRAYPTIKEMLIMPLYGALETEFQREIFRPAPRGFRKVVLATNIAATSLTIEGIRYVVDLGFVKQHIYDPQIDMDALVIVHVSQSEAQQRAGRAGRTRHGKCFRLYSRQFYENEMRAETQPELLRTSLANTVLELKKMGISHILEFEFMDSPEPAMVLSALKQLYLLGAIDNQGSITKEGDRMTYFPLPPNLARVLVAAIGQDCLEDVVILVSLLSVPDILVTTARSERHAKELTRARDQFFCPEGDHLTLLKIYHEWCRSGYSRRWSINHGLHQRHLMMARHIRKQLLGILEKSGFRMGNRNKPYKDEPSTRGGSPSKTSTDSSASILRVFCSGFFLHAARKHPSRSWFYPIGSDSHLALHLHPSSFLAGHEEALDWLIYQDMVYTTKAFMRCVSTVAFSWIDPMLHRLHDIDLSRLSGLDSLPSSNRESMVAASSSENPTTGAATLTIISSDSIDNFSFDRDSSAPQQPTAATTTTPPPPSSSPLPSTRDLRLNEARQKYDERQKLRSAYRR
jgi:HrpA-like RNA helicase